MIHCQLKYYDIGIGDLEVKKPENFGITLVTVISLLGLILACPTGGGSSGSTPTVKNRPTANDYDVAPADRNFPYTGSPRTVTVTPKSTASPGAITAVKYNDQVASATYPVESGSYEIRIDVEASGDWEAVTGLLVASMAILRDDFATLVYPRDFDVTGDFNMSYSILEAATVVRPTIALKSGVKGGAITVTYGGTSPNAFPTAKGRYPVTFDVAEDGVNKVNRLVGVYLGTITVTDPDDDVYVTEIKPEHFNITVGGQTLGAETSPFNIPFQNANLPVTIANKPVGGPDKPYPFDKQPATIQYWQDTPQGETMISVPNVNGIYKVRIIILSYVNVQNGDAWSDLVLNLILNVNTRTPKAEDFVITKLLQSAGGSFLTNTIKVEHVGIAAKAAYADLDGDITIIYTAADGTVTTVPPNNQDPSKTTPGDPDIYIAPPQTAGTYAVTFNVAASSNPDNWGPATGLIAGDLVVKPLQPINPSYTGYFWFDEDVLKGPAAWYNNVSKRYEYVATVSQLPVTIGIQNGTIDSTIVGWKEDGKDVDPNSDGTYTFNKTAVGWHWVTLVVKTADRVETNAGVTTTIRGKLYSETVYIRVQP